jgi:NADPH:quinone reductase-like Zn-dependent oxidoreductase
MADTNAAELAEIGCLIEAGKVKPTIQVTFSLEDAGNAEIVLASEHVRGKIVLTVS